MMIKNTILKILKDRKHFLTQYGVKEIGLFGSFIRNQQHQNSDFDILVDFNTSQETFDNLMSIYDILENSFKNHKIEIVTKNGLSKHIGAYVLNETEYV